MAKSIYYDQDFRTINGQLCKKVFCKYKKLKDGRIIFPKSAKAFCFWVPVNEQRA
jgi:hypothetical protein